MAVGIGKGQLVFGPEIQGADPGLVQDVDKASQKEGFGDAVSFLGRGQLVGTHQMVVEPEVHLRNAVGRRIGVAVPQVQLDVGSFGKVQIRRQIQGDINGAGIHAGADKLAVIESQLPQGDLPGDVRPFGGVVGLPGGAFGKGNDFRPRPLHKLISPGDGLGGGNESRGVGSGDNDKLAVEGAREILHFHRGRLHLGIIPEEIRPALIGDEGHGISGDGLLIQEHRIVDAPPVGQNAAPGGDDAGGLYGIGIRICGQSQGEGVLLPGGGVEQESLHKGQVVHGDKLLPAQPEGAFL